MIPEAILIRAEATTPLPDDFRHVVTVIHSDGSEFRFCHAMLDTIYDDKTWYIIYTKHCGYHIFAQDDLDSIKRHPITPPGW